MTTLVNIVLACGVLSAVIYASRLLTFRGTFGAFIIAVFIWSTRGVSWLLVLLLFFVVGSVGTKWKYKHKERAGTAEARKGRRSIENVLGSSYAPLLFVVFSSPVGFLASVAGAMADNLASELGVLSPNVRLITTLRRVPRGTDGGVSLWGLFVSFVAAGVIAAVSPLMGITDAATVAIIWLSGFAGSLFDSVLGATLERRGTIGKTEVNIAATLFSGLLALALVQADVAVALAAYLPFKY
ncbi:MAG: DUF92 domain-containing protein [Candidatus Aenigmarchaeota archaeon]|nr:DUF92 domain-containing protein [Candidatus Aenigmarchaeota archaeon]